MNSWTKKNFKENGLLQGDMVIWMILLMLCFISIITVDWISIIIYKIIIVEKAIS